MDIVISKSICVCVCVCGGGGGGSVKVLLLWCSNLNCRFKYFDSVYYWWLCSLEFMLCKILDVQVEICFCVKMV